MTRKKNVTPQKHFTDLTDEGRDKLFVTFETLHFLFLDTGLKWTQTKIWTITFIDNLTERHKTDYNNGFISRTSLKKYL